MSAGGLSILYEDTHLIAVDKPAGIHTAPLARGGERTLLDMIMERCPEISKLPGIKPVEPGLLHRLDRETSGIVVAARTVPAFERLRRDFAEGAVSKEYVAVSWIRAERAESGEDALSRAASGQAFEVGAVLRIASRFEAYGPGRRMVRVVPLPEDGAGGRGARTAAASGSARAEAGGRRAAGPVYETEARVEGIHGGLAVLRVRIRKGFRHQIRAHLASIGLPIAGDPLYGEPGPAGAPQRMYLHARSVEMTHPVTGERLDIESPMPEEFTSPALLGQAAPIKKTLDLNDPSR
jgi:23S rRNA pseudouridine1911/1915/1917 synthase